MSVRANIILVDWDQYPLVRKKEIINRNFKFGIQPFLENIKYHKRKNEIKVMLVINTDNANKKNLAKYRALGSKFEFITSIHYRSNYAMDVGAYDYGYKICLRSGYNGRIMFVNSSVRGPHSDDWLNKYEELYKRVPKIGISGATVNMLPDKENGKSTREHVQSWLLYSDMAVLKSCFGDSLLSDKAEYKTKRNIIDNGEIRISQKILNNGYGINCMAFPELHFFKGDQWPYPFRLGWWKKKELASFINNTIV